MVSLNAISIATFYIIIAFLIYKNKHKIELHKIFLLYRTQRGIKTINWLARFERFWRLFGYLAIPIGYFGMIFILFWLIKSPFDYITGAVAAPGVSLVIPGVKIPGSEIFIPFWYGIISLILLIIVHEGAHGVIARAHGIKVKNTGLGMFLFIPLAFVELEEEDLKKRPFKTQASVFAAGSIANFFLATFAILLGVLLIFPATLSAIQLNGVEIQEAIPSLPAERAGLQVGDVITSINGVLINSTEVLVEEMNEIRPGDTVLLGLTDREVSVKTTSNPENDSLAYLGVSFKPVAELKPELEAKYWKLPWILLIFSTFLSWLFFLNVGIGLFNLLPLGFVDGGRMAQVALLRFVRQKDLAQKIFVYISLVALFLLLLNLFAPAIF